MKYMYSTVLRIRYRTTINGTIGTYEPSPLRVRSLHSIDYCDWGGVAVLSFVCITGMYHENLLSPLYCAGPLVRAGGKEFQLSTLFGY